MAACGSSTAFCQPSMHLPRSRNSVELPISSSHVSLSEKGWGNRESSRRYATCSVFAKSGCWRNGASQTSFFGETQHLNPKHPLLLRSDERRQSRSSRQRAATLAAFHPPGMHDAVPMLLPLLGKAAAGVTTAASAIVSFTSHLVRHQPPPPPPQTSFFAPFLSFGPLPFLFGITSVFWALPLAIAATVFASFTILTVVSFLGFVMVPLFVGVSLYMLLVFKSPLLLFKATIDTTLSLFLFFGIARTAVAAFRNRNTSDLADLERRLSGATASPSAGLSIVAKDVPYWTYLPLLAPVGWWYLGRLAGDKATSSRCSRNMLLYAAPTAIFLCGLSPPAGGGVFLAGVLGPLHLELERRILRKERLLKLVDEAERAGDAGALKPDNGRRNTAEPPDGEAERGPGQKWSTEEDKEEQRKRAQELASFDLMLEARWWSGRAAPGVWSVDDVADWLLKEDFSKECRDAFVSNHITGDVLLELSDEDLRQHLEIRSFGLRRRLLSRIEELRLKAMGYNARS